MISIQTKKTVQRLKPLLGTFVDVRIKGPYSESALLNLSSKAFNIISEVESKMSYFCSSSELSYINKNAHKKSCKISTELHRVLKYGLDLSHKTDGIFDFTVAGKLIEKNILPSFGYSFDRNATYKNVELTNKQVYFNCPLIIDLGGIAKGFAVDKVFEEMDQDLDLTINAGGDLRMNHWKNSFAQIRLPNSPTSHAKQVPMKNSALATSATYFNNRDTRILSPHMENSQSIYQNESVSVFSTTCMEADALTKIISLDSSNRKNFGSSGNQYLCLSENGQENWFS